MRREFARTFAAKHPLFRASHTETGVRWQDSVYYLWWEYLRRHEGYRHCCERGGSGAYAKLYADFGNVHDIEFKAWWRARGVHLFAEPPSPVGVWALSDEEALELIDLGRDENVLLVAIPLDYRRRAIAQGINKILKESETRKRGEKRIKTSKARYPLVKAFDVMALKTTLACFDLKKANPKMSLWQIAQEVGVSTRLTPEDFRENGATAKDKKLSMASGVSRKLKQAEIIIANVGRGIFPSAN